MATQLRIKARPLSISLTALFRHISGCTSLGCLLPICLFGVLFWRWELAPKSSNGDIGQPPAGTLWQSWLTTSLWITIGLFSVMALIVWLVLDYLDRRKDAEVRLAKAQKSMETSAAMAARANEMLKAADLWIAKAQHEYSENAYSPYWDAVEAAAVYMDRCREAYLGLQAERVAYYDLLAPSEHNFPTLEEKIIPLVDPTPSLTDLQAILRRGLTEPHFAQIREHRTTQRVLIAGFSNLSDGLKSLEQTVANSIADLKKTISIGFTNLLASQSAILSSQNALLSSQNAILRTIRFITPQRYS